MKVRILRAEDAQSFQALRLRALRECPTAFASSDEEEQDRPLSLVAERLTPTSGHAVFGAYEAATLIGIVGVHREDHLKLAHKAFIWGMYVAPEYRQHGIGRQLLDRALMQAASMPGLTQVKLSVNTTNSAAIALYEAAGFERVGVEHGFLLVDGILHDEIQMTIDLTKPRSSSPPPAAEPTLARTRGALPPRSEEEEEEVTPPIRAQRIEAGVVASRGGPTGTISYCSFCGKHDTEAKTLVAGPGVAICKECVATCCRILDDRRPG